MSQLQSLNPRGKWKWFVSRICENLVNGDAPRFPVDRLQEFEKLFRDEEGEEKDLTPEEFEEGFGKLVEGVHHKAQWRKLFVDIDADRGGTVSWDEFTTFMVHQSVGLVSDYNRAKELVPLTTATKLLNAHKEPAKLLVGFDKLGQYASAGSDGTIRVWNNDLTFNKIINNSKHAATAELSSYVSATPICDMNVVNSVCCVASVDKCINLFHIDQMNLTRRYIGRNLFNDINIAPMYVPNCSKPIDTCILMGMSDGLSSAEFAQLPNGKEMFFTGLMDGSVLVYPCHRLSLAPEIKPAMSVMCHTGAVSKVRYERGFNSIITGGWDRNICIIDAEAGTVTTKFEGFESCDKPSLVGHSKAVSEFSYHEASKMLASVSSERDICLWNPSMATPITRLQGHTGMLTSVRFNDQENQLISMSQDNMIKVWDLRTFRTFQSIVFNNPLKLSTMHYDPLTSRLIGVAGVPYSWCVRRKNCGFPVSYKCHIEPLAGICYHRELDVLVTTDICTHMTWELKNGARLLVWEGVTEPLRFASTCLDFSGRRLCAITRDGTLYIYNHRSGQQLREEKVNITDVIKCVYVAKLPNHIYLTVISPNGIMFVKELADNDFEHHYLPLPQLSITCVALCTPDPYGVPSIAVGNSNGSVTIISATLKGIVCHLDPPPPTLGDQMQEYAGSAPISKQVEGITTLMIKGLILTVCGDRSIYVWTTGKKASYIFSCLLKECPNQFVAVSHTISERRMILGDEAGFVHMFDISTLPVHRRNSKYRRSQFRHIRTFSTHRCAIAEIITISHRELLVVQGTDLKIRIFTFDGDKVGTLGEDEWILKKPSMAVAAVKRLSQQEDDDPPVELTSNQSIFLTQSQSFARYQSEKNFRRDGSSPHLAGMEHMEHEGDENDNARRNLSRRVLLDELHKMHRTAMTPMMKRRTREGIVKQRSFTPQPQPSAKFDEGIVSVMSGTFSDTLHSVPSGGVGQYETLRTPSPTKWRRAISPTHDGGERPDSPLDLPPHEVVTLRNTFELSRGATREWARAKPNTAECRAEQRSETSKKIFDAKMRNPTGWSSLMVSSFLPVSEVPPSALEQPLGARKLPPLGRR